MHLFSVTARTKLRSRSVSHRSSQPALWMLSLNVPTSLALYFNLERGVILN